MIMMLMSWRQRRPLRQQKKLLFMVWSGCIMTVGIAPVRGYVPVVCVPTTSTCCGISTTEGFDIPGSRRSQRLPRRVTLRQTTRDSTSFDRPIPPESTTFPAQSNGSTNRDSSSITTTTTTTLTTKTSTIQPTKWFNIWKNRILQSLQRPGTKFRLAVALGTAAMWYVASTLLPPSRHPSILLSRWMSQRGFQGLAAFGRSIAYVWALFVAYPKWLNKKAVEQQEETLTRKLESKKKYLKNLAQEAVTLRSHMYGLESEIRSFRRDVLTLRAQGYVDPEIQDAIADEMAYLVQLKQDTQQALMAVKQAWSDARSRNPLTWDEDEYDTTTATFTSALTAAGTGTGSGFLVEESFGRISSSSSSSSSSSLVSRSQHLQKLQKQTVAVAATSE